MSENMNPPKAKWISERGHPVLGRDDVCIWFAELENPDAPLRRWIESLSGEERERAAAFHFDRDRKRFIAARAVLRSILGMCLGLEPRDLSFRYGPRGKPELAGGREGSGLRFNLSHSNGCALYAVSRGRDIGIDIEHVRPLDDMMSLALRTFSVKENAALLSLPEEERRKGFYDCWTRKEAFIKSIGEGLSFPLHEFDVSLLPGEGPRPIFISGYVDESRWTLYSLEPDPAYAAAIVVEGLETNMCFRRWKDERGEG